ncbi:Carbohydrate binding domain-containing protein [Paenibacillus sp. UNCCL117]|uniref:DUF4838 domain-containing protein n=1 Tax=unclassified Paenibacillus TaxID=185978 RepID=UPI00088A17C1|nr:MULTISPECIES: DUF4838 domain-containing protein [unclassified Paenibacillus]SDD62582.1 Carbohydrate binding domain-containing protein [Paenibacillus sp. cl123]SFW67662.1 Carbohydrate binding domain-containing protein [Paenibacillus sp. UNCCL117]
MLKQKWMLWMWVGALVFISMAGLTNTTTAQAPDSLTLSQINQVQTLLDSLIGSGDVRHPLSKQLDNALQQAKHQLGKSTIAQARKKMEDFLKHLTNKGMQKNITEAAKTELEKAVTAALKGEVPASNPPLYIVHGGQAHAVIVKPEQSGAEINEAADAMSDYIERSTGVKLPIYTVGQLGSLNLEPSTILLRIGEGSYPEDQALASEVAALHADGFIIAPSGTQLIITSPTSVGTRNGVYAFLEKYVGVTWLFPSDEWTDVPHLNELVMPAERWRDEPTAFSLRRSMNMSDGSYGDVRYKWQRENRTLSTSEIKLGHNMFTLFPVTKYGDTTAYPNFYPNNRPPAPGAYTGWQPCFSNPATVQVAIENIKEYFRNNPNEISFSLVVNDSNGFCEMNPAHPGYPANPAKNSVGLPHMSEIYYTWVNDVVSGVIADPLYANKWFSVYAYEAVIDPPAFPLHPQVIPVVTKDRLAWVDEEVEQKGKAQFDAWKEKATTLGWYDYMESFAYHAPRVYPHLVKDLYDYAVDHDVKLHHWDMHPVLGDGPQPWIIAKLGWNENQDVDVLLDHWYQAAVGSKAAADLKAYFEMWETFWRTEARASSWFQSSKDDVYLTMRNSSYLLLAQDEFVQGRTLLESVLAKAETPEQKLRAEQLLLQYEYYEASAYSYQSQRQINKPDNAVEALAILNELDNTLESRLSASKRRAEFIQEFSKNPTLKYPVNPVTYNEVWTGWNANEFWYTKDFLNSCVTCDVYSEIKQKLHAFQQDFARPNLREFANLLNRIDLENSLADNASFEDGTATWNLWKPDGTATIAVTNQNANSGLKSLVFTNAKQAGVWKNIDVKPGLLAGSVKFFTPAGTTSQGTVQIVIELHTEKGKSTYFSKAMTLADYAGKWTEVTFFDELPAQIDGYDIKNILINTQIKNAAEATVYLDDIGVYQVEYGAAFGSFDKIIRATHPGTLNVPVTITNNKPYALSVDVTSTATNGLALVFENPVTVPANQSVRVDGALTIPSSLAEGHYVIDVKLQIGGQDVVSTSIEIFYSKNILLNPGFEQVTNSIATGWQGTWTTGEAAVASGNSHSGNRALKLTKESGNTLVKQQVSVIGGETYDLSAWLKSEVISSGKTQIKVELYKDVLGAAGYVSEFNSQPYYNVAEWQEAKMQFKVPENANIAVIYLRVFGPGTAYFDDVVLEKVERPQIVNLLTNPGFEQVTNLIATGWQGTWTTGETSVTSGKSHSGNNALKLIKAAASGGTLVKQQLPVNGGETYDLSAWLQSEVTSTGKTQIKVELYKDVLGAAGYVSEFNSQPYYNVAEWQEAKMQFKVPENANIAVIYLRVFGPGTAYFDDVVLAKISP